MEEAGYYAAIAVLIAFGLLAGNRWARSMGHAVLLGLAGTTIAIARFRRSAAGGAPRKHRPGCFNGRNGRLPETRPAT